MLPRPPLGGLEENSASKCLLPRCLTELWTYKYVQSSNRPTFREYLDAFLLTGFNTLVVEPALLYTGYKYFYPALGHCAWTEDQCMSKPSLLWSLLSLPVFSLVFEVGFYTSHYAIHQKPFYRLIHKIHHRFKSRKPWPSISPKYACQMFFHSCIDWGQVCPPG